MPRRYFDTVTGDSTISSIRRLKITGSAERNLSSTIWRPSRNGVPDAGAKPIPSIGWAQSDWSIVSRAGPAGVSMPRAVREYETWHIGSSRRAAMRRCSHCPAQWPAVGSASRARSSIGIGVRRLIRTFGLRSFRSRNTVPVSP